MSPARSILRDVVGGVMAIFFGMALYYAVLAFYVMNGTLVGGDGSGGNVSAPTLAESLQRIGIALAAIAGCAFVRRRWKGDEEVAAALEREPIRIAARSRVVREASHVVGQSLSLLDRFVALLTFPGVIAYVAVLRATCRLVGVQVYEVRYFTLSGDAPGYVVRDETQHAWQTVAVRGAPLLVNSIGALLLGVEVGRAFEFTTTGWLGLPEFWLGFSLAMHAFSRGQDAHEEVVPKKVRPSAWLFDFALGWYFIDGAYAAGIVGMGVILGLAP